MIGRRTVNLEGANVDNPTELVDQAGQALVNHEWPQALDLFSRALAILGLAEDELTAALIAEAHNGRGVALLEMERYGEAVKALEAALLLKPEMAGAYYNLGLAWEGLGRLEEALHSYNQAIQLEPSDGEAYFRRGGIWFSMEQFDQTVEDAGKAIELHRETASVSNVGPYIARGLALHRLERYEEALRDYSEALLSDPRGAADAFFYRALVYMDMGEALPARADLQAFLTLTDDSSGLLAEQAREIIEELDAHL